MRNPEFVCRTRVTSPRAPPDSLNSDDSSRGTHQVRLNNSVGTIRLDVAGVHVVVTFYIGRLFSLHKPFATSRKCAPTSYSVRCEAYVTITKMGFCLGVGIESCYGPPIRNMIASPLACLRYRLRPYGCNTWANVKSTFYRVSPS